MSDIDSPRELPPRDLQDEPITELRASLHNLYNQDIFLSLPPKIQKHVLSFLPIIDLKSCRLISRTWNGVLVKYIDFKVELSDLSRFSFLPSRSLEKLRVTTIITRNLSKLSNPLNLQDILKNFRMKSPKEVDVKKLVFQENTTEECKNKLLEAYQTSLEYLNFFRIPFPPLTSPLSSSNPTLSFPLLKTLEISTKSYAPGPEVSNFFRHARFSTLKTLRLEFYARNDISHYVSAHSFIAHHNKTLRSLTLSFGYYLSDLDNFSKRELNQPVDESTEMEGRNPVHLAQIPKQEYGFLKNMLLLMKLDDISLNLSLNEGNPPFTLSFDLLDAQRHLKTMTVQFPSVLKKYSFNHVIRNNQRSLQRISVPCMINFDCSVLGNCKNLKSFSIGREFSFSYLFFGNRGSIVNFRKFPVANIKDHLKSSKKHASTTTPTPSQVNSVSICVPLSKADILWLSATLPHCHSLLLYGIDNEFFELEEVFQILREREGGTKKLMMRIYMNRESSNELKRYFESENFLILKDYFHSDCGFTTFIVQMSLHGEEEDRREGRAFGPGPSWGVTHDYSQPRNDFASSTESLHQQGMDEEVSTS